MPRRRKPPGVEDLEAELKFRQRTFVDLLFVSGFKNHTESYIRAGYVDGTGSKQAAHKLFNKPLIQRVIQRRSAALLAGSKLDYEAALARLATISMHPQATFTDAIRAIAVWSKMTGNDKAPAKNYNITADDLREMTDEQLKEEISARGLASFRSGRPMPQPPPAPLIKGNGSKNGTDGSGNGGSSP